MANYDRLKTDALLHALVAINFALARQIIKLLRDPEAAAQMRATAVRVLDQSDELLPAPADAIARDLVETVFLQ